MSGNFGTYPIGDGSHAVIACSQDDEESYVPIAYFPSLEQAQEVARALNGLRDSYGDYESDSASLDWSA